MEIKALEFMPEGFKEYYRCVRELKFDERPDYETLKNLLE
jgi:hypothetical protein